MKQEYSLRSGAGDAFKSYISETKKLIDSELSELVARFSELTLYPQITYSALSKGKRLRPLLAVLSAESVGGNRDKVMPLAIAFELMHTATLVHDDIIDRDDTRRGKPAVHKKWSVNDAILTGDAFIALAVELASGYGETVLKTVAESALELCDGEHMDITLSLETATEELYFRKIRKKSASLFGAATCCGALAGGGNASEVKSLSIFGENFGIAYQLKDDLLDLTKKGNMVLKDLEIGSVTLPFIHCYANSRSNERKLMERELQILLNGNRKMDNAAVVNILQNIQRTGSLDYCEKKMDEYLRQAAASISMLKDTEYRAYLIEMTRALKSWG